VPAGRRHTGIEGETLTSCANRKAKPMSSRIIVVFLALSAVLMAPVRAQSVRVAAGADPMEATVGETVVFTVRVEGASATVVRTPNRPTTVNLSPQRGAPRMQSFHSNEGGTLRRGVIFSWQFRPQRAGTAQIQPVTVVVRGDEYKTDPIRLRVTSSRDASRPTLTHRDGATGTRLDEQDLFVQATATADRAYQSEQVVVEYRLFYRPGIRLRHSRLADSWDAPGFWREELNVASRPTPQTERVDGRRYETVVLKRVALFPTRPGTLQIDPLRIETEAQGTMRLRRDGPALRGRFEPVQLASQRLSVRVRPLPPEAPASFDGAVGRFSMTARIDSNRVAAGESARLTVQVQGTGSLTTLSPPQLDLPSSIEAYEPTVESDIERNGRRIRGTKTFTYTLVPRSGGRYSLRPVSFSYFDPAAGQYETLRAGVSPLQVSSAAGSRARPLSGRTGDGLPVGDVTDLMAANEAHWTRTARPPLYRRPWVYLALLLPILLVGGGVAYRHRGRPATDSARGGPPDTSLDTAQAQLRETRRRLGDGTDAAVYDAVEESIRAFLTQRLGLEDPAPPRTALDQRLAHHDVPEALRDRLSELLDRCDKGKYAPDAPAQSSPAEVLDDAETLLRWLDEHLPPPQRQSAPT
jgi:hypothetical protein